MTSVRSRLYECLAWGFQKPTARSLVRLAESLAAVASTEERTLQTDNGTLAEAKMMVRLASQVVDFGELLDLEVAYNRLFVGPGRPLAHPYESVYREGWLMGEAAARASRLYAEAGFVPWPETKELPDHVAAELGYMAVLVAGEERAAREDYGPLAEGYRRLQEQFLTGHLGGWLPTFCDRVLSAEEHPFYTALARMTRGYVQGELQSFASVRRGARRAARRRTRYANIQVHIDPRLCTLCGICAEVCPTQALCLAAQDGQAALSFDCADCHGCRACQRYCPEGIITIEKGQPLGDRPLSQRCTLTSSVRVVCPVCGAPHVAQAWLERVIDRVGRTDEGFMRALRLCPACRAAGSGKPLCCVEKSV